MEAVSGELTSPRQRVTLKMIAQRLGVHHTTVSRALNNHPNISLAMRTQVQQTAEAMGYRPDPYLSALANYRNHHTKHAYQATVGWIMPYRSRGFFENHTILPEYLRGFRQCANKLGYQIDLFWLKDYPSASLNERIAAILKARGIFGLIIPPIPTSAIPFQLNWDNLSVVTFGFSFKQPDLHRIANDQYGSTATLTRKLLAMGYKKPGLIMPLENDKCVRYAWSSGFRSAIEEAGLNADGCIERNVPLPPATLQQWIKREKIDVVITLNPKTIQTQLEAFGIVAPDNIGIAGLALNKGEAFFGGISENGEAMGIAAMETLSGLLHHNTQGPPQVSYRIMIEGSFRAGTSLRANPLQ
jgi:LacI family transcriptional regulator